MLAVTVSVPGDRVLQKEYGIYGLEICTGYLSLSNLLYGNMWAHQIDIVRSLMNEQYSSLLDGYLSNIKNNIEVM